MPRLIIFPQYPAKMRYQEWWLPYLEYNFKQYFDEVIAIHGDYTETPYGSSDFSPLLDSTLWETSQITTSMDIIKPSDILLFCDISYPGFVPQLSFHYKDNKKFGYCHATSINNFDIFESTKDTKYINELSVMNSMDGVFFGTQYSKDKHQNLRSRGHVVGLPYPPYIDIDISDMPRTKTRDIGIISRRCVQKVDETLLKILQESGFSVEFHDHTSSYRWEDYLSWISECRCVVSLAREETYGYQVMDCQIMGVPFVAPDRFGYREVVRPKLRYQTPEDLINIINSIISNERSYTMSMSDWALDTSKDWYKNVARIMLC